MTGRSCEREPLVITAVRSLNGLAGLEDHIAACPACAETARLALLLRQAAATSAPIQPPPAPVVWEKLQLQRRQHAIRRATQCMRLMCILAGLYAVALIAWYLPELWQRQIATDLSPFSSGVAFAGVLAAILAVLIGSCCFAFLGSRTDFRLRS